MNRFRLNRLAAYLVYQKIAGREGSLVFLHDLGGAGSTDFPTFIAENFPGYERLLVDLLGFGYSDKPPGFNYTLEEQAAAVGDFLRESRILHAGSPVFVGLGMGAMLALLLITMTEGQNAQAILMDPVFNEGDAPLACEIVVRGADPAGLYQELLRRYPLNQGSRWERSLATTLRQAAPYALKRGACSLLEMTRSGVWRQILAGAGKRVAVITGRKEVVKELEEDFPGLRVYLLPKSATQLLYQDQKALAEVIMTALVAFRG